MITAREPKQEDVTDTKPINSRRGMTLIQGGRKVSKPIRIAISNDVFSTEPRRGSPGPALDDQSPSDGYQPANRGEANGKGIAALGLAIAVTASGLLLSCLLEDRRKR